MDIYTHSKNYLNRPTIGLTFTGPFREVVGLERNNTCMGDRNNTCMGDRNNTCMGDRLGPK